MDAEEVLDVGHTAVRVAVDAGHHGDVREVAVGQHLVAVHQHLEGLVGLPFGDELLGETGVQTTHEGHQTGVVLAMVETRVVEAAPSELVRRMLGVRVLDGIQTAMVVEGLHQGVVETGGVDAAGLPVGARTVADRHQTVGETLQLEVVLQAEVGLRTGGGSVVDGALPVVVRQDVHHHDVGLGEGIHAVGVHIPHQPVDHEGGILGGDGAVGQHLRLIDRQREAGGDGASVDRIAAVLLHQEEAPRMVEGGRLHVVHHGLQVDILVVGGLEVEDIAGAVLVLVPGHGNGQRLGLVGLALHLIDVPAGAQQHQVADTHVGTVAFDLLGVPEREGVVVAEGEEDGVGLARVEVVLGHRQGRVTVGAVVVVPVLLGHHAGHQADADQRDEHRTGGLHALALQLLEEAVEGQHAEADPHREGVEGGGEGVVTLTRLEGIHVQVDGDGDTRHHEEHEDHEGVLGVVLRVEDEAQETQEQREQVVFVVAGALDGGGQVFEVADHRVVDGADAGDPVAVLVVAVALQVVLTAREVPHKVTPVHIAQLVGVEELDVLLPGGRAPALQQATVLLVGGTVGIIAVVQPIDVLRAFLRRPHTREEHTTFGVVLRDAALARVGDLVTLGVLVAVVDRAAVLHPDHAGVVALAIDQRVGAVLLAVEVGEQRDGVLGAVLVDGGVGVGADHEGHEGGVADDEHQQREGADGEDGLVALMAVPDAPADDGGDEQEEEDHTRVEGHVEGVDEEEVELAGEVDHLGHDTPEDEAEQRDRQEERQGDAPFGLGGQRSLLAAVDEQRGGDEEPDQDHPHRGAEDAERERHKGEGEHGTGMGGLGRETVVDDEPDGREGQQVQEVHADGEAYEVGNQHDPAVRVDVGHRVFVLLVPLQDAPEDQGGEERRHGVDLALDGGEPEGVGEGVGQRGHEGGAEDGDEARGVELAPSGDELAGQAHDAEVEQHDGHAAAYRRHAVDAVGHLGDVTAGEERGDAAEDLERGGSRRVADEHFRGCGDVLTAVPPRDGGLGSHDIDGGGHYTDDQADQVIDAFLGFGHIGLLFTVYGLRVYHPIIHPRVAACGLTLGYQALAPNGAA